MRFPTSIVLVLTLTGAAAAHEVTAGDLVIGHPWSRATPATAKTGVGYLTVTNNGSEPDRLIGGSADVSAGFTYASETKIATESAITIFLKNPQSICLAPLVESSQVTRRGR